MWTASGLAFKEIFMATFAWRKAIEKTDHGVRNREDEVWSLFHENSKTSRYDDPIPNQQVLARMSNMWDTLRYEGHQRFDLPESQAPMKMSLADAIEKRVSARSISPAEISLEQLGTMLRCAYGITRPNEDGTLPRPFRAVPSGGALYPLELYVHTSSVTDLPAGLFHYNPRENSLRLLLAGDSARQIGESLVQPNLATDTSALFFLTAIFERSVFKYNNRGYRFILMEAGHVAQNLNLTATAMELSCLNIGGFFDRDIDRFLGLDGITHSTVYMVAIGADHSARQVDAPNLDANEPA